MVALEVIAHHKIVIYSYPNHPMAQSNIPLSLEVVVASSSGIIDKHHQEVELSTCKPSPSPLSRAISSRMGGMESKGVVEVQVGVSPWITNKYHRIRRFQLQVAMVRKVVQERVVE